ncbi:hypothetical protein AK830_g7255 [Neonectria ditissima]|uniref:Uncharacterized protein n=1 Tax=Neonectria ditissima TaxID=78410 RepID=A0A0P7BEI0_9HYPO|nr:hypothetical protein AK830_g7255 [Neonectria ditissima]
MFDAFRPHFLLLTQDGHRRQYEPLDVDDFRAAHTVISSLGSKYMAIYNCGVESGCSRFHKHLQIIPQAGETFNVWRDIIAQTQTLPYQAFVRAYDRGTPSPEELQTIYLDLFQQAQIALGQSVSEDNRAPPHNVIFDQTGIMVIPRRAAGLHGAEANAAGMLGVIWMSDMAKAEQWLELGPAEVLKTAGVPKSSTS